MRVGDSAKLAVVVPAYRVCGQILSVLQSMDASVWRIYVVDDACPDRSGEFVRTHCDDPRVQVIRLPENQGVGGAVMAGYRQALADGADLVAKVDGDGQMDPRLLPQFVLPILEGRADYTKGNRFFSPEMLVGMPWARLLGNGLLSFISKFSSGYWDVFDPVNGYTVIHARVLALLPLEKISRRYFLNRTCCSGSIPCGPW